MKDNVKKYCEWEYMNALKRGYNPREATTRSYGAVMFAGNYCGDPAEREEIFSWWDDGIHPKFRELGAC